MKKALSLILALAMCLSLSACGGAKSPAKNDVQTDLQEVLLAKNPYAELKNAEVDRSLTEEDHYEVTYNVTAETKYADWTYQVQLNYTKYDQGWKFDNANWISAEYEQVRYPSIDVLAEIINNWEDELVKYMDDIIPVQNGEIDYSIIDETGILQVTWTTEKDYLHAVQTRHTQTYWRYDATADSWKMTEKGEGNFYDWAFEYMLKPEANLCGTYDKVISVMKITELSEEKITAIIDGEEYYFNRTYKYDDYDYMYQDDESGKWIALWFREDETIINIYDYNLYLIMLFYAR